MYIFNKIAFSIDQMKYIAETSREMKHFEEENWR